MVDLSGARRCDDERICYLLWMLTQGQIDQCVEFQHDEDSSLRIITVDTRGYEAEESVLP